jgi:hypothetical protein
MTEVLLTCPKCASPRFSFNVEKGVGHCFVCKTSSTRKGLKETPAYSVKEFSPLPNLTLQPVWEHDLAAAYLLRRNIPRSCWHGITYCPEERRLYFRIWSPSPEIPPSWHGRAVDNQLPRWKVFPGTKKQHYIFGIPLQEATKVLLVEGIFDAMSVGTGAISLLGSELSETQRIYLRSFSEIMLWKDPDEAGEKLASQISASFPKSKILNYHKDAGSCIPGNEMLDFVKGWLKGDYT